MGQEPRPPYAAGRVGTEAVAGDDGHFELELAGSDFQPFVLYGVLPGFAYAASVDPSRDDVTLTSRKSRHRLQQRALRLAHEDRGLG